MAEIDFSTYMDVASIVADIKSVKIQGATNVAIATFEGLKLFISQYQVADHTYEQFLEELNRVGYMLAYARPNEPLAKNGLKFVTRMLIIRNPGLNNIDVAKEKIVSLCNEYLGLVKGAKERIVHNGQEVLGGVSEILTHCHSSTSERLIIEQSKKVENFKAVCTETRPLFQGRTTATNLVKAGIETTLIVDSAVESFVIDRGTHPIDVIFLGADEITMRGDAINKIGSWGIALAAYYASKPVYVIASILKTEVETAYRPVKIEYRDDKEIWSEAPENLKMVNPAFEIINKEFIAGFITEVGVIKPADLTSTIQKEYQWLF